MNSSEDYGVEDCDGLLDDTIEKGFNGVSDRSWNIHVVHAEEGELMDPNEALRLIRLTIAQMRVDESPAVRWRSARRSSSTSRRSTTGLKTRRVPPVGLGRPIDVKELLRDLAATAALDTTFQESCCTCVAVRASPMAERTYEVRPSSR